MRASADERRDSTQWPLFVLWALSAIGFGVFTAVFVPRLTNYNAGDMDLTGFTGVVASKLTAGERAYLDFVTPLAPGSLLVLSALERLSGRLYLIDELWLIGGCRLLLALLGYAIAVTVTSRKTATLIAIGTFALLVGSTRDNAFELLGQLGIWASLACGARGWSATSPLGQRWWTAAGACSALTLGFEPRCAISVLVAWLLVLGSSALRRPESRADLGAWGRGAAIGLAFVVVQVLACRSTLLAFGQSVLSDGLTLAGGPQRLVAGPLHSALFTDAYSSSLLVIAATLLLARNLLSSKTVEPEASTVSTLSTWGAAAVFAIAVVAAIAVLLLGVHALPRGLMAVTLHGAAVPGAGIVLGAVHTVWQLRSNTAGEAEHTARRLGLLFAFSLVAALIRDPWLFGFRPAYGGDVLTAVSLTFLFLAARRSRSWLVTPLIMACAMLGLFGIKLNRALEASTPVREGYWSDLYVNHRGVELLSAARRVRELAGPDDTVLVVPEDPQIAALIGRPRPHLRGSIVFSDQYPERLLDSDRSELERRPPRVVVAHPRRIDQWHLWLAVFSPHRAAGELSLHVLLSQLPARYRFDSSYRTTYVTDQGALDVWVLDESKSEP